MQKQEEDRIAALLDHISEVCPLPAAAQRVIALSSEAEADIDEISKAIATDPALANEALRIANSAFYRRSRAVDTINQAIVMLGLRQINAMAMAMAMMAAFRSEHEISLEFHASAVISGNLGSLIARETPTVDEGTAFLAGLLCEIGAMACVAVDGQRYVELFTEAAGSWERRAEMERDEYSLTSWEIGERLLQRNQLPEKISIAVGAHYDLPASMLDNLARITIFSRVAAADLRRLSPDDSVEGQSERIAEIASQCSLEGLSEERLVTLCDQALALAQRSIDKLEQ